MALKALLLRKQIDNKKKELEALRGQAADFEKREAELTKAIDEVTTDEERQAVEAEITAFDTEKAQHGEAVTELERTIAGLEDELKTEEANQNTDPPEDDHHERSEEEMNTISTRAKFFGMNMQERAAFVAREDVKGFLGEIRTCMKEKRALTNVGLTIPTVMLGLLRENIINYSKLYRHVYVRAISGEGKQLIMGTAPEAVWTDCCANLNELDLSFFDMVVDCYKVGGYFAICNATLEDSDIDLAAEVLDTLGQAIGKALDKAILFGRNTAAHNAMPMGIASRLVQTSQPESYPATQRPWVDLHTSNVKALSADLSGANLIAAIVTNSGAMKGKYSRGEKVWVMNEATYTALMAATVSVDASGRIVTGVADRMPVVGGLIEVLEIVPDNMIIGGYFDLYTLAERAGQRFAQSEHVRFLQDQTVFKGTARYDGAPAIAEAFVIMMLNNGTASTAVAGVTFAPDEANSVQSIRLNTSTASITGTGTVQLFAITSPGTGTVTWTSATTAKATVDQNGVVTGVTAGTSVITATANGLTASCTVTVT